MYSSWFCYATLGHVVYVWKVDGLSARMLILSLVVRLLIAQWLARKKHGLRKNKHGGVHLKYVFVLPLAKKKSHFKSRQNGGAKSRGTSRNLFHDQPLLWDIVVFVVCCLFPSFLGFNPTLTRRPPVLSEEWHRGSLTVNLKITRTIRKLFPAWVPLCCF